MATKIERQLPNDINAEAAVLSAMMIDNFVVSKAIELLDEEHFYRTAHKIIYKTLLDLFEENIEIDIITVIDRLKQNGTLEKVGGENFINELSDVVLSGANIEYHANIVQERALLRQLITTSNQIIEECYKSDQPVEDIVDNAEQEIFRIAERPERKTFVKIDKIIPTAIKNIEEIATSKKSVIGVPSGFPDLDKKIGGFRPGQFVVIAARPAMGKTSLALNIAFNASMYYDKKVAIFTMEMDNEEILLRMMSSASEVSMDNMLKGYGMDEKKILRIAQVAEALSEKEIFVDDVGSNTLLDIRAKTRRLKAEIKGLDMLIIDYLQLMSVKRNRENRQQEIAEISRSLKILAKEMGIPIIALSQLNRAVESRKPPIPMLADLRESGAIEQDADIVMFIYREEEYDKETEKKGIAKIIISKNRHGATGEIELLFVKELTAFRSLSNV
ncbi:MAG TPA: replicative DNA helicase [Candidatus Cloacimonetes bacterium]|nr:replicative DNA helicase [Candidatus Cloacimonadota bacterium]